MSSNSCTLTFEDELLEAGLTIENENLILILRKTADEIPNYSLKFDPPYRAEIGGERLKLIVETLLSHDYLLTRKLHKQGEISFTIPRNPKGSDVLFETITSVDQDTTIRADQKILPWLLPCSSTEDLYPFQVEGVTWLLAGNERLLADDMGLGKTVQTIFATKMGFSENLFKKALILCPKSLVLNWLAEFRKWSPELRVLAVSPPQKDAPKIWKKTLADAHIVIANYDQVREANDQLRNQVFDLVVADEAHKLRKASSQIVQGFKHVQRQRFWALTGTPIERNLEDLATLMSLLDNKRFSISDAKSATAAIREQAKPYILRRTKESVLENLPEVIVNLEKVELHEKQKKSYELIQSGVDFDGNDITNPLHILNELRRVCDYDPASKSSIKLDRIHEELLNVQSRGEKAIVFSFVLEPIEALLKLTRHPIKALFIDGSMCTEDRENVIHQFKNNTTITALYASSKVASEGLTLVEANHVFFVNRWWNPSSNTQARDRVVRIGQKKTVFVHEFICVGTIEERVQQLLESKKEIYGDVVGQLENIPISDLLS